MKLFVVGFPRDMEEIELVELFSAHGQVSVITIVTDKDAGSSKGYGFITMTDQAGADRAIPALDGTMIDERTIQIRIAENKTDAGGSFPKTAKSLRTIPTTKKKRPRRPL